MSATAQPSPAKPWNLESPAERAGVVVADRFEVGGLLGEGGGSWVYACKDRVLHVHAAIKILKASGEDARQRFVEEARILANLRHPHLVHVLAIGETDTRAPFMVLELLPGENLEVRLRREGPQPWREVARHATQVASALAAMHRAGVIHRDVKPGNIVLLCGATGQPLVKLIDLGIAKVDDWELVQGTEFSPPVRRPTDAGMVVGTPGFHAPEAGLVPPAPPFDTFALGVTIHLLCTGEMPNLVAPRPMGEVRVGTSFPPEFEALVANALAVVPEDRIATAGEFERRLAAILAAHPDEPEPHLFDGCYELLEVLGVGAKAEVYRAYHRDAARYVALKILSDRSARDPEERRRFAREALALGATSDPALPTLVECRTGSRREKPYIAMTLAPGRRASEYCVGEHCLEPAAVVAVGRQLAEALAALHARGILHRDVHAGNVLIEVKERVTATLVDVGMAHFEDAYYARSTVRYLTPPEARVPLGTGGLEALEWTAPEARAQRRWTARSDVYSLGLLLYRLLTGKKPMKAGKLVPPRTLAPGRPLALESALLAALHEDPTRRLDLPRLSARLEEAAAELLAQPASIDEAVPAPKPTGGGTLTRYGLAALIGGVVAFSLSLLLSSRGGEPDHVQPIEQSVTRPSERSVSDARAQDDATPPVPVSPRGASPSPQKTLQTALTEVEADLRSCARLAGGFLLLKFTTETDRAAFAAVSVVGEHPPAVSECVEARLRQVRFAPEAGRSFIVEYTP